MYYVLLQPSYVKIIIEITSAFLIVIADRTLIVICPSVYQSVRRCIVALKIGVGTSKLYHHAPRRHFLFTSSDTFAERCIV